MRADDTDKLAPVCARSIQTAEQRQQWQTHFEVQYSTSFYRGA
jgi:hypothetical protein